MADWCWRNYHLMSYRHALFSVWLSQVFYYFYQLGLPIKASTAKKWVSQTRFNILQKKLAMEYKEYIDVRNIIQSWRGCLWQCECHSRSVFLMFSYRDPCLIQGGGFLLTRPQCHIFWLAFFVYVNIDWINLIS